MVIPGNLKVAFVSFLEFAIDDLLGSFGGDLEEDELAVIELLTKFCQEYSQKKGE